MNPKNKLTLPEDEIRLLAARRARGVSLRDLEAEFSLSRPVINRLLDTDLAKQVVKDVSYDIVAAEVLQNRRAVAELLPKAVEVILKQLEEGNLKAAELVIRASGMLTPEQDKSGTQQQAIQVIMPNGFNTKEVMNVKSIPEGREW